MIKHFTVTSSLLTITAVYCRDTHAFNRYNLKRCYVPPWQWSIALCSVVLPISHSSPAKVSKHRGTTQGCTVWIVPLCVLLFTCWHERGRQLSQPRMIAMHTGGLNTHFFSPVKSVYVYFSVGSAHHSFLENTSPHCMFPVRTQFVGGWGTGLLLHCTFLGNSCGVFNRWLHQTFSPVLSQAADEWTWKKLHLCQMSPTALLWQETYLNKLMPAIYDGYHANQEIRQAHAVQDRRQMTVTPLCNWSYWKYLRNVY